MKSLLEHSKRLVKDKAPTILTCVGAVGMVATTVAAVKATPKAIQLLQQAEHEKGEELTKLETVQVAGPIYIPSILLGVSTIACIFGANVLNKHQQAAMISAYGFLSESHQRYRNAAKSVYGEDADARIHAEMAKETYISPPGFMGSSNVYDAEFDRESEDTLFYDVYSCRYFTSSIPAVLNAQYHINRNFTLRGGASVNEFYTFLGIDGIASGDDIGWGYELIESGIVWIDFQNEHVKMEDGMECYIISTVYEPTLATEDDCYNY